MSIKVALSIFFTWPSLWPTLFPWPTPSTRDTHPLPKSPSPWVPLLPKTQASCHEPSRLELWRLVKGNHSKVGMSFALFPYGWDNAAGGLTWSDDDRTILEIGIHNVWEFCRLVMLRVVSWLTTMRYVGMMQTIAISRTGWPMRYIGPIPWLVASDGIACDMALM
jgi:hypothetical protein